MGNEEGSFHFYNRYRGNLLNGLSKLVVEAGGFCMNFFEDLGLVDADAGFGNAECIAMN